MSAPARTMNPLRALTRLFWNPILERELRASGRRTSTYVMRMLYAGAFSIGAILAVVAMFEQSSFDTSATRRAQSMSQVGEATVLFVGWFQFVTLVLLAPIMTSPSICEEKQRGTLGALMTTPLTAIQIVLGKLTGRLYQVLLLALISVPLLFAVRVFGGVTVELVLSFTLVTFTTALFAGSLGLLFATWHTRAAPAAIFALLTLALFFAFPPIIYYAMEHSNFYRDIERLGIPARHIRALAPLGVAACPPYMLLTMMINGTTHSGIPWLAGTWFDKLWVLSSTLMLTGSLITILITARSLRRIMLDETGGAAIEPQQSESESTRRRSRGPRVARLGAHPVYWREASRRWITGRFEKWVLGGVLVVSLGFAYWKTDLDDPPIHLLIGFTGMGLLLLCAAVLTSTAVNGERASDTWDTLMAAPVSAREVILGKYLAAVRRIAPFFALIALHFIVTALTGNMNPSGAIMILMLMAGPVFLYLATGLALSLFFTKTAVSSTANIVLMMSVLLGVPVATVVTMEILFGFSSRSEWLLNTMFASHPILLVGSVLEGELDAFRRRPLEPFSIANERVSRAEMLAIVTTNTALHLAFAWSILWFSMKKFTRLAGRSS